MKFCPFCGAGLDEGFAFCPKCGKPFESEKENSNLVGKSVPKETPAVVTPVPSPVVEASPKKKKSGRLIAIVAVVVVLAIVGGLFVSGAFAPKEEPVIPFSDDTEAIEQASKSVVMLTCYDKDGEPYATGSGFAVFEEGIIVTNYHVIEQEVYRVKAQTEGGISFECPTVLAYDAEKDIAILKADRDTGLTLLSVGTANNLQKGAKVVAIGSPLGLINSVSTGVFSGYIEDEAGSVLQFTAPISHGSSGGALFNDEGEVIGITFASLTEGQSLNLGVPIDDVKALYEYAGSQKAMSIESFYDTFDHTPPIPTYTVGYVLEHYEELNGQEFYLEGYLSSISVGNYYQVEGISTRIYLVDRKEDILGFSSIGDKTSYRDAEGMIKERNRTAEFKAVTLFFEGISLDWLKPNDKVSVHCQFEDLGEYYNGEKTWGGFRLSFTPIEVTVVD